MEFNCSCPNCQQLFVATEEYIGVEISCPNCSGRFTVPSPAEKAELTVQDNELTIPEKEQCNSPDVKFNVNKLEQNDEEEAVERLAILGAIAVIVKNTLSAMGTVILCVFVFRFFFGHHYHPATTWSPEFIKSLVGCTLGLSVFMLSTLFTNLRDLSGSALVAIGWLMLGLCTVWSFLVCLQLWGFWSVVLACLGFIFAAIPIGVVAAFFTSNHDIAEYIAGFSVLALIAIFFGWRFIQGTANNKNIIYQKDTIEPPMGLILSAWVLFVISFCPIIGLLSDIGLLGVVVALWFSK